MTTRPTGACLVLVTQVNMVRGPHPTEYCCGKLRAAPGGKKLTDRRRWPTVIQNEVLILTRDIMFLQRYRPKSACYWCLSSCD